MSQLFFFGAETMPPAVADLSGLLAAHGQVALGEESADLSIVVDAAWRATAIAQMMADSGLEPEIAETDGGHHLVRTVADAELASLAARWTRDGKKVVPIEWAPGPRAQRAWFLASGRMEADGERYVLGLDPHAPDTHAPLAQSLMRAGIAPTLIGTGGASPGLRISGRRRLTRLVENIGAPPDDPGARVVWPHSGPDDHHA